MKEVIKDSEDYNENLQRIGNATAWLDESLIHDLIPHLKKAINENDPIEKNTILLALLTYWSGVNDGIRFNRPSPYSETNPSCIDPLGTRVVYFQKTPTKITKSKLTSLELSKELHSLGVRVESAFVWIKNLDTFDKGWCLKGSGLKTDERKWCSAYSVAELGKIELRHYDLPYWHEGNGWQIPMLEKEGVYHRCDNEACARAKMLIHLIKNNLLDVTKLKA